MTTQPAVTMPGATLPPSAWTTILSESRQAIRRDFDSHVISQPTDDARKAARDVIEGLVEDRMREFLSSDSVEIIDYQTDVQRILDDVMGLGPLQPLLDDPRVEEILVNSPGRVFAFRNGEKQFTDVRFEDDEHVINIIDRMLAPTNRHADASSPMVDAQLPDGSRLNVIIPPLAQHPVITIRKFLLQDIVVDDLVQRGSLTRESADFLVAAVRSRCNILVAGGTGSGKTTALNAFGALCNDLSERIIVIEETSELQMFSTVVDSVSLQARPPNLEGHGEVTIRALVRNALRMRPTRIIVGEIRGGEALDMLTAMTTGHEGSMCTIHASNARGAIERLQTYALRGDAAIPHEALMRMVVDAIQFVVYLRQDHETGRRYVEEVFEVVGIEASHSGGPSNFTGAPIFELRGGQLTYTGTPSRHRERLARGAIGSSHAWLIHA